MIRWMFVAFLTLAPCMVGCARHYTYLAYTVIHTPAEMKVGDEVQIVPKAGDTIRGTLVRIEGYRLTVAAEGGAERTVAWEDIRALERVRNTRITVY